MTSARPPTIDPVAAARWEHAQLANSPWLHEEVGRRMEERLQWIRMQPAAWADWHPLRGGLQAHDLVLKRYKNAQCRVVEADDSRADLARRALAGPWWRRMGAPGLLAGPVPDGGVQLLWANMALHMSADPQALIAQWHRALATDGFLMFSCFGPDTLRELRALYALQGWPPPAHDFTDMHDWGDMLVHAGFAEPVMDMERITLTWASADKLLGELAQLGTNLHPARFPGLRGRTWRAALEQALTGALSGGDGRLALTFEIIYGHAFKPAPRVRMSEESAVSLQDMRALLRSGGLDRVRERSRE
ncbi:biotin synthase [Caenimonas koreensis]|uniref:biotin synthase n=1 Tax=Caenimonas koreensis TaxID=367474 RepID=UPI003783B049